MGVKKNSRVFTSGEVAQICGVSADTVSRWFDLGQIQGYRLGPGGDRRIPFNDLRSFMVGRGIPLERLEEQERAILIVDDDPYYLDIISAVLSKLGENKIIVASTGFDVGAQVVDHNPHLIVLDIHLSDMDGRTICQRVKSRPETRTTRILAISGYIEDDEVDDLKDYGFDGYLKKPFPIEELGKRAQELMDMPASKVSRPRKVRGTL